MYKKNDQVINEIVQKINTFFFNILRILNNIENKNLF